jgi:Gamma tubulin complex component N-terminal
LAADLGETECDNVTLSTKLIDELYLLICNLLGMTDVTDTSTILNVFIDTMQPLLAMIDRLLTRGILEDPFKEFFISRYAIGNSRSEIAVGGMNFWTDSIEVRSSPDCLAHWVVPIVSAYKSLLLANNFTIKSRSVLTGFKTFKFFGVPSAISEQRTAAKNLDESMDALSFFQRMPEVPKVAIHSEIKLDGKDDSRWTPFKFQLEDCLEEILKPVLEEISINTSKYLFEECKVQHHLQAVSSIYLMMSSMMNLFYDKLLTCCQVCVLEALQMFHSSMEFQNVNIDPELITMSIIPEVDLFESAHVSYNVSLS